MSASLDAVIEPRIAAEGQGRPAASLPENLESLALFLDLDGTLIDISAEPDKVDVPKDLAGTLRKLSDALDGALAIVTGRTIATVDGLLAPVRLPVAGVHGNEIRFPDGSVQMGPKIAELDRIRQELAAFVDRRPPLILEDKVIALGVHYRAEPKYEPEVEWIMRRLAASSGGQLAVQQGKMVVEMRPAMADKGAAVRAFMAVEPFLGRRPIAFGDDLTDENMFDAVNALGGLSIRIGADGAVSGAKQRLADPATLRLWLSQLIAGQKNG